MQLKAEILIIKTRICINLCWCFVPPSLDCVYFVFFFLVNVSLTRNPFYMVLIQFGKIVIIQPIYYQTKR
jgi:hypothetical protein